MPKLMDTVSRSGLKTTFPPPQPSVFCYSHLTIGTLESKYRYNHSSLFLELFPFSKSLRYQGPQVF